MFKRTFASGLVAVAVAVGAYAGAVETSAAKTVIIVDGGGKNHPKHHPKKHHPKKHEPNSHHPKHQKGGKHGKGGKVVVILN